jgi:hypothetical protein
MLQTALHSPLISNNTHQPFYPLNLGEDSKELNKFSTVSIRARRWHSSMAEYENAPFSRPSLPKFSSFIKKRSDSNFRCCGNISWNYLTFRYCYCSNWSWTEETGASTLSNNVSICWTTAYMVIFNWSEVITI